MVHTAKNGKHERYVRIRKNDQPESDYPFLRLRRCGSKTISDGAPSITIGNKVASLNPEENEGVFAEWNFDGNELRVHNDRYGFSPLFYFLDLNQICISPSVVKLLALGVPTQLDATGMAVFLRLGWFIGDHTPFEKIRALPPGTTLTWRDGICNITSHGAPTSTLQNMSFNDAVDGFIEHFDAAIRRYRPPSENFVIPLTGGRDSRHILLALRKAGFEPDACVTQRKAYSSRDETDKDILVAKQLCSAMGIRHFVVEQMHSKFTAELRKNVLTDFCSLEHAWAMPLVEFLTANWKYSYDGLGGDVLSAGLFLTTDRLEFYKRGKFEDLANELLGKGEGYLPGFLPANLYKLFNRNRAVENIVFELVRHADSPNPVGQFFFHNRTRRAIAQSTSKMFSSRTVVLAPYLDHQVYDFLSSLPASLFLNHKFHTLTIQRAFPKFAQIPFAFSKPGETFESKYCRKFAAELARNIPLRPAAFPLIRRRSLVPRVLRCLVDPTYSQEIMAFGTIAAYLQQLERYYNSAN